MFDQHYRPWLIEVNASPAVSIDSEVDEKVKLSMLKDAIRIVEPQRYCREELSSFLESHVVTGGKRCRRLAPSEFQAKLASVLGCAVGDALPARTAESLGGYEQIVPSAAFDAVKAEYNSNVRDPKPRRRHH